MTLLQNYLHQAWLADRKAHFAMLRRLHMAHKDSRSYQSKFHRKESKWDRVEDRALDRWATFRVKARSCQGCPEKLAKFDSYFSDQTEADHLASLATVTAA